MKKAKTVGEGGKYEKDLLNLKHMVMSGDDFMKMYDYYFDIFIDKKEFMRRSKKATLPRLKRIIAMIGEEMYKREVTFKSFSLMRLRKSSFYHGRCFFEGSMGEFFYFKDIDYGIFAVVGDLPETFFIRFSTIEGDPDDTATVPSIRSKAIH